MRASNQTHIDMQIGSGGPNCLRRRASHRPGSRIGRLVAVLASVAVVACSTTPPPLRLHSLVGSESGFAGIGTPNPAGLPIRLVIAPIKVPAAVDRPQWLVRRADDSLQLLEEDRWASPLADELKAALRARLSSRWRVVDGSQPDVAKDAAPSPAWRLVLEILRLDARPVLDVQLEARWTLVAPHARTADEACSVRIVEPIQGQGTLPISDAYRRAAVQLADQIGAQLRGAQPGPVPGCGAAAAL